jgi:hypothetical protein
LIGIGAALVAGFGVGGAAIAAADARLVVAVVASVGTALLATVIFAGLVWLLDRRAAAELVRWVRPRRAEGAPDA